MTKPVTNFAASARARLLIATNKRKGDYQQQLLHTIIKPRLVFPIAILLTSLLRLARCV